MPQVNPSSPEKQVHSAPPARRTARRLGLPALLAGAIIIAVAGFYLEENWRGRRAWLRCESELEQRGVNLHSPKYRAPQPNREQDFFFAPNMAGWFLSRDDLNRLPSAAYQESDRSLFSDYKSRAGNWTKTPSRPLAMVRIAWPGEELPHADLRLRLNAKLKKVGLLSAAPVASQSNTLTTISGETLHFEAGTLEQIRKTLKSATAEAAGAVVARSTGATGAIFTRLAPPHHQTTIAVAVEQLPDLPMSGNQTVELISNMFPDTMVRGVGEAALELFPRFQPPDTAAGYIEETTVLEPDLALIRNALHRPFSEPDNGENDWMARSPINYVALRSVAQVLDQRARCFMLLEQPGRALAELTLLHDLAQAVEMRPSGQPMPLTSTMVKGAFRNLFARGAAEGLRLRVWRDSDLSVLEAELTETNLLPMLATALECSIASLDERVEDYVFQTRNGRSRLLGSIQNSSWSSSASSSGGIATPWRAVQDSWEATKAWVGEFDLNQVLAQLEPRGWGYLAMAGALREEDEILRTIDPERKTIRLERVRRNEKELAQLMSRFRPGKALTSTLATNLLRACRRAAAIQSSLDMTRVACALERYRLANGAFPEELRNLVPTFATDLPHDVINGEPLHYRRQTTNTFLLYSVGWDGKDDGGVGAMRMQAASEKTPQPSAAPADWVWPMD